ncbi:MAG: hypothetical protein PHD95_05950 [Candidatus ainarchaeum sp.]|nr:hypothetical protein [Candidatus ainarchaeum sp.]
MNSGKFLSQNILKGKNPEIIMKFDLLRLHDSQIDADMKGSWIKANGPNLNFIMKGLLSELCKEASQNLLARKVQNSIGCSFSTAKRQLTKVNRNCPWISLKIISVLLEIWKEKSLVSQEAFEAKKWQIIDAIEFLKVGQQ